MAFIRWNQLTQIWELAVDENNPSTAFNHLPVQNPTQALDIANKQYVDASAAPPGVYVPYTGAVNHVNLGIYGLTAAGLQINGNAGVSGNTNVAGRILVTGGSGVGYSTSQIELQSVNYPRISFHWPGVVASQIGINSAGTVVVWDSAGGYGTFAAGATSINGALSLNGALVATQYLMSTGVMYPGRVDVTAQQSSWYLASHGNWGLYTNTGLYVAANVYVGALGGGGLGSAAVQSGISVQVNSVQLNGVGWAHLVFTSGVLTSYIPAGLFRLENLLNAPGLPGDVYTTGDGILRITL